MAFYLAGQFGGAFLGCFLGKTLIGEATFPALAPATRVDWGIQPALAEIWGTFLFTLVILCISHPVTRSSNDGAFNGFIVIITLYSVIN